MTEDLFDRWIARVRAANVLALGAFKRASHANDKGCFCVMGHLLDEIDQSKWRKSEGERHFDTSAGKTKTVAVTWRYMAPGDVGIGAKSYWSALLERYTGVPDAVAKELIGLNDGNGDPMSRAKPKAIAEAIESKRKELVICRIA